jgi:hypothetical protein
MIDKILELDVEDKMDMICLIKTDYEVLINNGNTKRCDEIIEGILNKEPSCSLLYTLYKSSFKIKEELNSFNNLKERMIESAWVDEKFGEEFIKNML